jgi:hypothetical protein
MPAKHLAMQAAINTHLSQSIGTGALVGQHGMSFAISSAVADADTSATTAGIDTSADIPATTGRDNGANASPAIIKIASSRRIVISRSTPQNPTKWLRLIPCRV